MKLKKLQNKNLFIIGISILFSCKEKKQETIHCDPTIPSETSIVYSAHEKDSLKKVMNLRDQKKEESIFSIKKQISIPSGEYFTINEQLEDYGISLKIENDSIIYTESGDMGKIYNQYLLKEDKEIDGKIFLKYSQTINGYTGDANKVLHFGSIYYDKNKLIFDSEYMQKKYGIKNITLTK